MTILSIIHESHDFIVINKPSGLLSVPDRFNSLPNVFGLLTEMGLAPLIVHRLDKDTSGIILFAKNPDSHRSLSLMFQEHAIEKCYIALVNGTVESDNFTIDLPIANHPHQKGKSVVDMEQGKPSSTIIKVSARYRNYTQVEAFPKTGRQHQIRVHLAACGNSLAIDPLYGSKQPLYLSQLKSRYKPAKNRAEKPLIDRLTLHASQICFSLKETKYTFDAPLPKDFRTTLNQLDKLK